MSKVFIGADHRGFSDKEAVKEFLTASGHEVVDKGAFEHDPTDDYPDFAYPVAKSVAAEPGSFGILLCGSGMGMDVVANKVRGVRATVGYSREAIVHARAHDDINVLTLAADELDHDTLARYIEAFLTTERDPDERHLRRLKKIQAIEDAER